LPDLNHANHNIRAMAERMAVNTPIQGTAADLIKLAMLAVHRAIGEQGLKARMILQVHDELVFEAPEDELESMTALVKTNMEGVMELKVPLVVDTAYGPSWAEAH
jgi:DNA polymerase-1